jgi:RNA polymerase sigma factor (TIGR02999 family)
MVDESPPPPAGRPPDAVVITSLLTRATSGDRSATNELFPLVYDDLRRIADRYLSTERHPQTLQPTALVHEAYLRLVGPSDIGWESRAHFFGAAAQAIRRILVDRARAKDRLKRGSGEHPLRLDAAATIGVEGPNLDVLALDEALQRLSALDAQKAQVVELRFFGGLSVDETAATLGVSASTVAREWTFSRLWLYRELGGGQ